VKSSRENICKFVTESTESSFITLNFVFEKKNTNNGKAYIRSSNCVGLCCSGNGTLKVCEKNCSIIPGTLFFTFTGEQSGISGDDTFEYMYISFKGTKSDELFDRFGINSANRVFDGYETLIPFWQSALSKADSKNLDLLSESVLLYTFSQMSQCDRNSEQYLIGSIIKHIEDCFADLSLSLSSTAESLGYNPKYISRIFSKNVGTTFSEYLKNTRIKHAVFLMENGVTTVKNVALLSGYSDPLYFSNVFKSSVGMSPSEFLRNRFNTE